MARGGGQATADQQGAADGPITTSPQPAASAPEPAQAPAPYVVPPELIEAFKRDGVVVLPDVFTAEVNSRQHVPKLGDH